MKKKSNYSKKNLKKEEKTKADYPFVQIIGVKSLR